VGLIDLSGSSGQALTVHPVVADATRARLLAAPQPEMQQTAQAAVLLIQTAWDRDGENSGGLARLIPHLTALLHWLGSRLDEETLIRILDTATRQGAVLTLEDRITITLLARRFTLPGPVLATLFQVSTTTINKVISQTLPLLTITGHHIEPAGLPLRSLTELAQFAANAGIPTPEEIKSARR
jgi:predicted nuclease of predicted toxin-antitoxin system